MKPNFEFTPDALGDQFDLTAYPDITGVIDELNTILESLGLRAPQLATATAS